MELNSLVFIFLFLPLFVFCFYFLKNKKLVLGIFGILYYCLSDLKYLWLLLIVSGITYIVGKKARNNKTIYVLYLITVILLLCVFKYGNLVLTALGSADLISIIMPVGISYYLFEAVSYVSDVYRGKYEGSTLINVFLYLSFFPTILTGPIIRFDAFESWLNKDHSIDYDNIANGLRRFIVGLAKKIIVANQLYVVVEACYESTSSIALPMAWMGLFAYALRLYFDFSGCSDMAIGIASMIGYAIPENFNEPYCSKSISEFFRRWHISLGSWFKDYIYIPMGGNRVSAARQIINIMVVWIVTGLWHGSSINYMIWGLYLGVAMIIEKKIISRIKLPDFVRWLYTTLAILFGWLIFSTGSLHDLLHYGKMMVLGRIEFSSSFYAYFVLVLIAVVLMVPKLKELFDSLRKKAPVLYDVLLIVLLVISVCLMVAGSLTTSMYANF